MTILVHSVYKLRLLATLILFCFWIGPTASAAPPITAAALTFDHRQIVIGSQSGVQTLSWPELKAVADIKTELEHVHDLAFSPDGSRLLVAGGSPAESGTVEVWNWPARSLIQRCTAHKDVVYRVAWTHDGKQWSTAGADGICQVFSDEGKMVFSRYTGHSRAVLALQILPDDSLMISTGIDQTLRVWNRIEGVHLRTLDQHVGPINDIAIRPRPLTSNGAAKTLAEVASASEDRTVRLWQPTIGRLMRFVRLPSIPKTLAWSPTGDRLYVGCNDGQVRILDPATMQIEQTVPAIEGRIHTLLVDQTSGKAFVGGEAGRMRVLTLSP